MVDQETGTPNGPNRGQSSVVGYVLVIGFTLAMASSIVLMGATAVTETRDAARTGQAEQAMSQLAARGSLAALGDAGPQRLTLSETSQGRAAVDPDAGRIEVLWISDAGTRTLVEVALGRVEYTVGDTAYAYQAGGVWRRDEAGSTMVSPPQYHYRDRTLTFPIVRVTGSEWAGSPTQPLAVEHLETTRAFPTASEGNPLESGHVHVRVTSDYHGGWAAFFETRTEGTVQRDPANDSVSVNLTVPFTAAFDNAIATTDDGPDAIEDNGNPGGFDSPQVVGVERPSASPKVEAKIDDCEAGNCTDLDDGLDDDVLENGTYYADGDVDIEETTYDTTGGDIDVVVDGDLEFAGSGSKPHHEIVGDGRVTFYLNGSMFVSGNTGLNTGGQPSQLLVLMHSNGGDAATSNGNPQFTGFIYAPNASLTINGGGSQDNIVGGVVVRNATANGGGNLVYGDPGDIAIEFEPIDTINWLHVTENRIDVQPA